MSDCIFGVKYFGDSIIISESPIGSDIMNYEYICTVSEIEDRNDNRTYDVSIVSKDNVSGILVGKWKIKKAKISKDWGRSFSYLVMEDEQGIETSMITACQKDGGTRSRETVSFIFLIRTIFDKAQEIVRNYPSAEIYNVVNELEKFSSNINLSHLKYLYEESKQKSDESYLDFIKKTADIITKQIDSSKKAANLLKELDDQKYNKLRNDIFSKCKNIIENLISNSN